ncbi:hypothetical protein KBB27_01610 [Patescibacteria group bacterium]|nr:hypothetical protein [Patescibacteria group bacterium]
MAALTAVLAVFFTACGCPSGNVVYCALPATPDAGLIVYSGDRPVPDALTSDASDASDVTSEDASPPSDGSPVADVSMDVSTDQAAGDVSDAPDATPDVVIDGSADVVTSSDTSSLDAFVPDAAMPDAAAMVDATPDVLAMDALVDRPATTDVSASDAADATPSLDVSASDVVADMADASTMTDIVEVGTDSAPADAAVDVVPSIPDLRIEYRQATSIGSIPAGLISSIEFGFDRFSMVTFSRAGGALIPFTGFDGSNRWWYAEMRTIPTTVSPMPRYAYATMPAGSCANGASIPSCPLDWACNWRAVWRGRTIDCASMVSGVSAVTVMTDHNVCFDWIHQDVTCVRFDLSAP